MQKFLLVDQLLTLKSEGRGPVAPKLEPEALAFLERLCLRFPCPVEIRADAAQLIGQTESLKSDSNEVRWSACFRLAWKIQERNGLSQKDFLTFLASYPGLTLAALNATEFEMLQHLNWVVKSSVTVLYYQFIVEGLGVHQELREVGEALLERVGDQLSQIHADFFCQAVAVLLASLRLAGREPEAWLAAIELAFGTKITEAEAEDWVTQVIKLQEGKNKN